MRDALRRAVSGAPGDETQTPRSKRRRYRPARIARRKSR
jgi:hypothetical protein